jgi:enoyl-CoA hydratase/carnithine racemase
LLRAAGRAFSAGADLGSAAFAEEGPGRAQRQFAIQRRFSRVVQLMRSCPQPIVALVQGAACGGAFSIVLASDVRFISPEGRMNAAYLKIGLSGCDMASSFLLPRLVGLSSASEFLLTGRFINAERALAIGLVSQIVPEESLLTHGLAIARDMLKASPMGLRLTKDGINAMLSVGSLEAALAFEDRQQVILTGTQDHKEAMTAFKERRAPSYRDE